MAKNGILDLKDWDFKKQGPVQLKGEWRFLWKQTRPSFAMKDYDDSEWDIFTVPNFWNAVAKEKYGHAWFRLKVINLPKDESIGIYLLRASIAYELYCNGRLILKNGLTGRTRKEYIPQEFPLLKELNKNDEITLAWHISNFHNTIGGPGYTPKIGCYEDLNREFLITNFINYAIFGIILMMGVYHFILWLFFKIDRTNFFFSLFCFTLACRILLIYKYIQQVLSSYYLYDILMKIETFTIMFGLIVFLLFFKNFFMHEFSNLLFKVILMICIVLSLLNIIFPTWFIWDIIIIYYITLVLSGIWLIYMTIMAIKNNRMGGIAFFLSMIVLFFTISFDMIATCLPDMDTNYIHIGMMTILFSQSFILSKRFAEAYKMADHLSKNLRKEVAEQTKIIREKNEEKTTYFINFAHETKTPLTLILNYLKKYIQKKGIDSDLNIIQNNIEKLKKNMVNFLDYEKLEKGQTFYNHEEITDLSGVLEDSISLFKETAAQKQITINSHIKKNIHIKADPYAIIRVINNLIDNALKYTEKPGRIDIELVPRNNRIELIIKDTGIGIEREQLTNIFKSYYQISHKKQNIQGIGMGLSIVKKILDDIEAHITVCSRLEQGSEFRISFKKVTGQPLETQGKAISTTKYPVWPEQLKATADVIEESHKKTILIAEDNPDMISYLYDTLNEEYNVYCACNGKQALAKLEYIPNVHLVVSDIMMDIMDGYEFYDKLKKGMRYRHIPVIFLTVKNTQYEKIEALQKGVVDFICKPFDIEELKAKISSIIKINESQFEKSKHELIKHIIKVSNRGMSKKMVSDEFDKKCRQYHISLREKEIMLLLFKDKQYKKISNELGISPNTVKTHISNIYKKFGVKNKIKLMSIFKIT